MKTLYDVCTPRESVFDLTQTEDVLNLSDLVEGTINSVTFFEENYVTDGMQTLFDSAFSRFINQGQTGVIKLTQAMGGGKTHNMIALGLLAEDPDLRTRVMAGSDRYRQLARVRVVAFSGRESDAEFGIWGVIAEQLGRKAWLEDYYAPLKAPGETAWINLLAGEPLLILLDELPPYLENAKSISIGHSDLCAVTSTALANLFTALGKARLSNVCLVISDLKAAYESGSELIRGAFTNLESEVNRSALNIEPVGTGTDDIYQILKKRLFSGLPDAQVINQVATAYQAELNKARQMGLTNTSPDHIYTGIKEAYPFHPSIRDLYARFKENLGFQQTRGLIRLMRQIVAGLYTGDHCEAKKKYLINVYDFDLNDRAMLTTVTQIKPELANAIAHDIAASGNAVAEQIDTHYRQALVSDVSKIILVSSLANIPNALLGLNLKEIIGYLCEPGRDIAGLKKGLDEFQEKAWYLEHDREGKLYFKNVKNMIAVMHSLVESYENESVKTTTLKVFLTEKFKPIVGDCYQNVLVFPAIDEIDLRIDQVTLILFEPFTGGGLHPRLNQFFENTPYKNRVMFLSGSRDTMARLYEAAKHLKAIEKIIANLRDEKVPENNQQYMLAQDTRIKKIAAVLSAARETFSTLYYPMGSGIRHSDFTMQFTDNNYNGEEQIKSLLKEKQKFSNQPVDDTLRRKCEDRLFTRKTMSWSEIKTRAAAEMNWPWLHPGALDQLQADSKQKDLWRERGQEIEKGPFPKEPTSLSVTVTNEDEEAATVTLHLQPRYGDLIYYETGAPATPSSLKVEDPKHFVTSDLKVSFLCVDSTGSHPSGPPLEWKREIKIKYNFLDRFDGKYLALKAPPGASIKYTTDGSDPKYHGGTYHDELKVPDRAKFVLVVAEHDGSFFDSQSIPVEPPNGPDIDQNKPLVLTHRFRLADTADTYDHLSLCGRYAASLQDVRLTLHRNDAQGEDAGWIEVVLSDKVAMTVSHIEDMIGNLKTAFVTSGTANIELEVGVVRFDSGRQFLDFISQKNMNLKHFKREVISQS